jgi:hypothetical protein
VSEWAEVLRQAHIRAGCRIIDSAPEGQRHPTPEEMEPRATVSRDHWARREGFHQTDTVDYAVVLEGKV